MTDIRIDQSHTVPPSSNLLIVVRDNTGPCCWCSSPGLYLLRDAGQAEKVLCRSCLDRIRQVLGMQLDCGNAERAKPSKPPTDFDYFLIYPYGLLY